MIAAVRAPRRLHRLEGAALRGVMVREIVNFSSFWRSSTFSSTVDPTIYLLAFGFGFGSLVFGLALFIGLGVPEYYLVFRLVALNALFYGYMRPAQRAASQRAFAELHELQVKAA